MTITTGRSERRERTGQSGDLDGGAQPSPRLVVGDGEREPGAILTPVDPVRGPVSVLTGLEHRAGERGGRAGLQGGPRASGPGAGEVVLEDAVWRLTGHAASAFRIAERGLVREGYFADLVAFDPATVGATAPERVYDFPGGADRLIARSTGVTHTWVNGVASRIDGEDIPDAAGQLLRG
ncbi:MAG TPA: amidohydrolase family protein [Trebonia sp.]|jgi:hypothetical protein